MNRQKDETEIWNEIDILINHFKQYNLEKRISKVAIEYVTNKIQETNTYESMKKQIENVAVEDVNSQIKQIETQRRLEEKQQAYESMKKQIENVAVEAVNSQIKQEKQRLDDEEKQRQLEENEKEKQEQEAYENMKTNIEKTAMDAIIREMNMYETKNLATSSVNNIVNQTIGKLQDNTTLINNIKQTAIDAVSSELIKTQIKDVAIKEIEKISIDKPDDIINAVPVVSDIESSIENVAKNEVNENMVKRDLEEVAKTKASETLSAKIGNESERKVTDVASSTTANIENDLKNAAITALYRALLEVPIKPLIVKTPPSDYDVLITDKTYEYNKKTGEQKEIPELTKYYRILAK
jgi:hypothetical protein